MSSICLNCYSKNTIKLRSSLENELVPMSDGALVKNFNATQFLCENCSCVFTEYYPEDRLRKYFSEEYNVTDVVQDCQVVINNLKNSKHSIIHTNFLNEVSGIKKYGKMLEIACGEGNLTRKFAGVHTDWECTAIDPSLSADFESRNSNVTFIRDFFSPELIGDSKFDVIIAHGILNRTPTLALLDQITRVSKKGCIVSLEVVLLEDSTYAPFIWDHSFTYLKQTFIDYLEDFGLVLLKEYDCGSTVQFVCEYDPLKNHVFRSIQDNDRNVKTLDQYREHIGHWRSIKDKFNKHAAQYSNKKISLFGAGLYTAVLFHLIDGSKVDLIIDEFRNGSNFQNFSVDDFSSIQNKEQMYFLLNCRKKNLDYLYHKIKQKGFNVIKLL